MLFLKVVGGYNIYVDLIKKNYFYFSVIFEFDFDSISYYLFLYIVGGIYNFLSLCILVMFFILN